MASFQALGDRAPIPCDIGDADGVAMAFMEKGTTVTPLPFRQPPLLDHQLRIRVTHAGLCHSDLFASTEQWQAHGMFPLVTGHEIVGIVEKVGQKVTKFHEGDKVGFGVFAGCCSSCYFCNTGADNLCAEMSFTYLPSFGGYATSFQNDAAFFFKLHEEFQGALNAPLFCAGATTYSPIKRFARPGMKVGIVGIGGLGHMGIQYAKAFGCEVYAISTTAAKEEEARKLGAHHFIHSRDPEQLKKNARSLDFILETGSSMNLNMNFALLKPRSSVAVVGAPATGEDAHFNIIGALMAQQELHGSHVGSRLLVEDMLDFSRLHNINVVSELYPFADTQAALDSLGNGNPHFPKYRNVIETESFFKNFTPRTN